MKVILYMATTANGYIASEAHDTPWSDDEWNSYSAHVKEVGNLIVGKTTYDIMLGDGSYAKLGNPAVVCLTSSSDQPTEANHFFVQDFPSAMTILQEQGFDTTLVGGGAACDTAALESGLIDEIFLDVEPIIFGQGIPLFRPSTANLQLKLVDTKKIGDNGLQLHYKVIK